jgi:hypothetical protein
MSAIIIRQFRSPESGALEITERVTTRDHAFSDHSGWGSRATPPPGSDWVIKDFTREKRTTWERRRLILLRRRP